MTSSTNSITSSGPETPRVCGKNILLSADEDESKTDTVRTLNSKDGPTCCFETFKPQVKKLLVDVLVDVNLWGEQNGARVGHRQVLAAYGN